MIVGVLGRTLSGTTSITALIPLFFGLPIAVLGWLSQSQKRAKWMQIIVLVFALLGIFGTYSVIPDLFQADRLAASLLSRCSMFLLCIAQVVFSGNWLFNAQRK